MAIINGTSGNDPISGTPLGDIIMAKGATTPSTVVAEPIPSSGTVAPMYSTATGATTRSSGAQAGIS